MNIRNEYYITSRGNLNDVTMLRYIVFNCYRLINIPWVKTSILIKEGDLVLADEAVAGGNAKDKDGLTPLHLAAREGYLLKKELAMKLNNVTYIYKINNI